MVLGALEFAGRDGIDLAAKARAKASAVFAGEPEREARTPVVVLRPFIVGADDVRTVASPSSNSVDETRAPVR